MTSVTLARAGARPAALRDRLAHALRSIFIWRERARSRAQLAGLNDRLLRDVGLDRATAARELDKSFWQS